MIVVSACLAGMACKYNGKNNNTDNRIVKLVQEGKAVPVCPEMLGGLPCPRIPSEKKGNQVINQSGIDVTNEFVFGANQALAITKAIQADTAILKERSPSCGMNQIYDGSFTSTLVSGDGVFVELLRKENIKIYSCDEYFQEEKEVE